MPVDSQLMSLRRSVWWLHPFEVAAFPVLFLFSQNIREQVSLEPLWPPLGVALVGTAALLLVTVLIGWALGAHPARAALVTSLLVVLTLTYGHAWNLAGESLVLHRWLLAAWAIIALAGIFVFARLPPSTIGRLTTTLAAGAGLLVVINVIPMGDLIVRTIGGGPSTQAPVAGNAPATASRAGRDVWYLVFDRYSGAPALAELYGNDNAAFTNELRERGFVIADGATANYLKTAHSLVSSLNMEELDADALAAEASAPDDWTPLYRDLQGSHAVERFLHDRGYRYLHMGLRRGATFANSAADVTFLLGDTTEFSAVLADTTLLRALENVAPDQVPLPGTTELYARQTLFQLDELERIATAPGPNFVFAHLLLPHPPFVFNADGSRVTPEQSAARTADERYLEHIRFANARILSLLDRLQSGPRESWPIVVLASDEGPFPERYAADQASFAWEEATDEELLEKFSILTAVLMPGTTPAELEGSGFSDTITPVNLFRVIFNAAFGADLPLLEDRNRVFTDQRHIYDLVDVTHRVQPIIDGARSVP